MCTFKYALKWLLVLYVHLYYINTDVTTILPVCPSLCHTGHAQSKHFFSRFHSRFFVRVIVLHCITQRHLLPRSGVTCSRAFLAGPEEVLTQTVSNISVLIRQGLSGAGVGFR